MNTKSYRLFSNCIVVKGAKESIIQDILRQHYFPIPNLLTDILAESEKHLSVASLKTYYNGEYDGGIDAYFNFLDEHELGFYTDEPQNFPKIDPNFTSPFRIISASIEIENEMNYDILDALTQMNDLGCSMLDIRFSKNVRNIKNILDIINTYLITSRYKILNIYIPSAAYEKEFSIYILQNNACINAIVVFGCEKDGIDDERYDDKTIDDSLYFVAKQIDTFTPDEISPEHFVNNTQFYIEALEHNTGLNRKIAIARDGNIKNHLSHELIFGNISKNKIADIIKLLDFQKLWTISNDNIEKCKDCQFRYMCLSNTDIIQDSEGKYHKQDLCRFNPYTNEWE